jgi:hypothetical protein
MTQEAPVKLPPMSALEFAIEQTFRNFFFGVRLAILWAILLAPLTVLAWYMALRDGMPDFNALKPDVMAASAALSLGLFIAGLSISVSWHRRILLGETPRRLGWVRLDGTVWRYLGGVILVLLSAGVLLAAAAAAAVYLPGTFSAGFRGLAGLLPVQIDIELGVLGYLIAGLLGFSALFTFYRLLSWLPAIAVGDRDYDLRQAWKATRGNRFSYLSFTFWLVFVLAIAGAIGTAAVMGAQVSGQGWALALAFGIVALLGWLARFLLMTVATSHYHFLAERGDDTQ